LDTGQLFGGHRKFCLGYNAQNQAQLRGGVLRQVSAHGLTSLLAPYSLKHPTNMVPSDKDIWDAAYDEE
jgi:hypothetical protein